MNKTIRKLTFLVEINERKVVFALVSIIILCGIIYSFYLGDTFRYYDEYDYYRLARNIVSKHMFTLNGENPTAYRAPGYPLFLSLFITLGASITYLRILNFFALGFSVYLLYLILKNLSSEYTGFLGILLVMCYPVLFYAASLFYPQTIGSFLFLLILFILSKSRAGSSKPFFTLGFLFGYLILTVPYFIFSLIIIVLWIIFFGYKNKLKASVAIVLTAFIVIGIWSVRNYTIFDSFVFVHTSSGTTFLKGNCESTTPNSGVNVDISKYIANMPHNLNEVEKDRYFKSKGFEFILNNKMTATKLYILKVLNYFNFYNKVTDSSKNKNIIMFITYMPLLMFFILRVFLYKRFKFSNFEKLFIILYFSNAFFLAIFFTRIRFRLTFDFLLIAIVAMFIYNFSRARTKQIK